MLIGFDVAGPNCNDYSTYVFGDIKIRNTCNSYTTTTLIQNIAVTDNHQIGGDIGK